MKIGFYKIVPQIISNWVFDVANEICIELGYDSHTTSNCEDCYNDDITFLLLMSWHMLNNEYNDFKSIYKKSKCVALVNVEQLVNSEFYKEAFLEESQYCDCVVETLPEQLDYTKSIIKSKPVVFMPFGYHHSMTTHHNYYGKDVINWDVFKLELGLDNIRLQYHERIKDCGWKLFNEWETDLIRIGYYVKNSKVCLCTHARGENSYLSAFRVLGMFIANEGFVINQRTQYPYLEEGKHIIYFDEKEDMIEKIKYYLEHQEEAKYIARNAFEHVSKNLKFSDYINSCLNEIIKIFNGGALLK